MGYRSDSHSPVPGIPYPMSQALLEAGVTFKKSTTKGMRELDFVPVNLHVQQMKVKRGEEERGMYIGPHLYCLCMFMSVQQRGWCTHV